jgi:hypothetical protein
LIDKCDVELSDVDGKIVWKREVSTNVATINMAAYKKGVFFLKATNSLGEMSAYKIVKI